VLFIIIFLSDCYLSVNKDEYISSKFQRWTYGIRPWQTRRKYSEAIPIMTDKRKWRPKPHMYVGLYILPVSINIFTFSMNESSTDILAWSIYFATFENNSATFYGNPLCAVDCYYFRYCPSSWKCTVTVVYTSRSHFQYPTFKNTTSVKFTSVFRIGA